ncbi:MAG: hypothetical protein PHP96_02285 [Candidatus Dojkabacteria bacterium]|nr:hypothetical protein [Candidatus Dojkabacteria bacterium]MDD4561019.1 hypothetical protein [Candidatus Dojkabacteria bacterium]
MEKNSKKIIYVSICILLLAVIFVGVYFFPFIYDYISVKERRVLPKYAKEVSRNEMKIHYVKEYFCELENKEECPDEIEVESIKYEGRNYTIEIFAPVENGKIRIPELKKDVEDSSYPDGIAHGEVAEFNYHIDIFFRGDILHQEGLGG